METIIQTASGGTYELRDTPTGQEIRRTHPDDPKRLDGEWLPAELYRAPEVGLRMIITLRPEGKHPFVRSTTPVVGVYSPHEVTC